MPNKEIIKEQINKYNQHRQTNNKDCFCYVPFMNILFTQEGKVKFCCYNDKAILGKYPEQSLAEMWAGKVALATRYHMLQNDLPAAGCDYCAQMLLQNKFYDIKPSTYDRYTDFANQNMPIVLEFELKNTCNLECKMCNGYASSAIRKNREKLPPIESPYDDNFVEQLRNILPTVKEARFYGGEPFLIDIYYKIWELIIEVNPNIRIYTLTNGTIWNERIANIIRKLNFDLGISLDSINKKTFETIRKNANFEKVMDNFKSMQELFAKDKPGHSLTISTTPILENLPELPNIVEFCNKNLCFIWLSTVNEPQDQALVALDKEILKKHYELLRQKQFPQTNKWEVHNYHAYQNFLNQLRFWAYGVNL